MAVLRTFHAKVKTQVAKKKKLAISIRSLSTLAKLAKVILGLEGSQQQKFIVDGGELVLR